MLQGHGQSGVNRDYVLATVKAIEAEGFRDSRLRQLAAVLHDQHPQPLPAENSDPLNWGRMSYPSRTDHFIWRRLPSCSPGDRAASFAS